MKGYIVFPMDPALPEGIHGFFKILPRELRDSIHDMIFQEIIVGDRRCPGLSIRAPL